MLKRIPFWVVLAGQTALMTSLHLMIIHNRGNHDFFQKYIYYADQVRSGNIAPNRLDEVSPGYLQLLLAWRAAGGSQPDSLQASNYSAHSNLFAADVTWI